MCLLEFSFLSIFPSKAISSNGKTEAPPPKNIVIGKTEYKQIRLSPT